MNSVAEQLVKKIEAKTTKVAVVGLGYVGLPFAVEKCKVGFQVIGIDVSEEKCERLNRGDNYVPDVDAEEFRDVVAKGLFRATTDFSAIKDCDVIIVAVPTPLTRNLVPDLGYVESATKSIAQNLRHGHFVSFESTTYPGTTEEVVLPILQTSGLVSEEEFFLAYSPERVDPGNRQFSTKNTCKLVGGIGPNSSYIVKSFYSITLDNVVAVSSAKIAEFAKVFENTFRSVNIALVNEMTLLCDRMGISVWEVLDAAFTKPFGIMPFYPGPGVGGHCIPLDPHYLEWKAKEYGFHTHFISLATEINRGMPSFVVAKAGRFLNSLGLSMSQANILVLGVTYKRDIDDARESPAVEIVKELLSLGARLSYHDPYVPTLIDEGIHLTSVELTKETLGAQDLVILATDHSKFVLPWILEHSNRVFDTRNATKHIREYRDKLELL